AHRFFGLLLSRAQGSGISSRHPRALVAGQILCAGASQPGPNFLVSLLGHDRPARAPRHGRYRVAWDHWLDGTARKFFRQLPHASGNLRVILALRGHRLDLSVSAPLSDQSLYMNSIITPI